MWLQEDIQYTDGKESYRTQSNGEKAQKREQLLTGESEAFAGSTSSDIYQPWEKMVSDEEHGYVLYP